VKNLETYERVILRDLFYENDFLDIYVFYKKYLLSPLQILSVLEKYAQYFDIQKEKIGTEDSSIKVKLNDYGRLQVWQNRYKFFKTNDEFLGKNKKDIFFDKSSLNLPEKSLKYVKNKVDNDLLSI
jgi:hypothetical protein